MSKWTVGAIPSMSGKVAIVTGANSGLGLETSVGLASAGATLVMACRNAEKAQAALEQVRSKAPQGKVDVMTLDLSDLASVRSFAAMFKSAYPRLDLLVNNAGVMALPFTKTRDGFEMQIGTNHLGHFALTGQLFDRLQATPGSRIVNVASMAHRWTDKLNLDDLNFERSTYRKWDAYGKSKLANLTFTFELDRRLKKAGSKTIVAAAHPGYSATNLQFVGPAMEKSVISKWMMDIGNLFAQPADMGALPQLYAATMPDVQGGDYIGPDGFQQMRGFPTKVGCRSVARDPEIGAQLWAVSEKLTGVSYLD